jgi:DNA-binding transcriptional LysR family regulator
MLVTVADAGGLRRGASKLGVSQPALSKALRELESTVGRPLFLRSRQGLQPTAHGVATIEHARRLLRDVDALSATLDAVDVGAGGRLRLGVIPNVSSDWLRAIATRLVEGAPAVALQVVESATDVLLDALRQHKLDCLVGRITPANAGAELSWRPVFEQTLRVVARAGHPLLRRGPNPLLAHLAAQQWVLPPATTPTRELLDHVFIAAGLPKLQTRLETHSLPLIESLVSKGDYLAAVPDDIARQFQRRGGIKAFGFGWKMPPICVAWLAEDEPSPLIARFAKVAVSAPTEAHSLIG